MTPTKQRIEQSMEDFTLSIVQEIHVRASVENVFEALLEQMGPFNEKGAGEPMPMILEAWPGGRWFRDLGDNNGHFWGNVQAIKRPSLLEITGPLFASYPFLSNVQYRLSAADGGTLIVFRHTALGFIEDGHRQGVGQGWSAMMERVRKAAESRKEARNGQ
jgi:uncharacterized protein YndB with AHSA1/START domain